MDAGANVPNIWGWSTSSSIISDQYVLYFATYVSNSSINGNILGSFDRRGLDARYVDDLIRTVKPGGIFIIGMCETWLEPRHELDYPYDTKAKLEKLEREGKLEEIDGCRTTDFDDGMDGVFLVYRIK